MNQSRLLSWPTYLCQSSGGRLSQGLPRFWLYQFATSVVPSGFMLATSRKITLSRMNFISSDSSLTALKAISGAVWPCATSIECSPKSIQTTALPSRASCRACASSRPRASASRRAMSLYLASDRRFCSDEMIARSSGRPSAVLPISTSCMRAGAAAASFLK